MQTGAKNTAWFGGLVIRTPGGTTDGETWATAESNASVARRAAARTQRPAAKRKSAIFIRHLSLITPYSIPNLPSLVKGWKVTKSAGISHCQRGACGAINELLPP